MPILQNVLEGEFLCSAVSAFQVGDKSFLLYSEKKEHCGEKGLVSERLKKIKILNDETQFCNYLLIIVRKWTASPESKGRGLTCRTVSFLSVQSAVVVRTIAKKGEKVIITFMRQKDFMCCKTVFVEAPT